MADTELPDYVVRMIEQSRDSLGRSGAKDGLDIALEGILEAAVSAGLCDLAGVTERIDGGLRTAAATQDRVRKLDRAQYDVGQGPCVQATFDDGILLSQDLSTDPRWPLWTETAVELGAGAIIGVHLYTARNRMGALNLYSNAPRAYTTNDLDLARFIAANASLVLANHRKAENLWTAIDARHRIGIAQGILMGRYGIGLEQSFETLQRLSSQHQRKISEIAALITDAGEVPEALRDPR